ncbi:MAG: hypothetical protein IBX57_00355 [Gammaproteobacteria bacterium]|nr:hypothetical protein [Gammaproteobacteria bacterium]
MSGIGNFVKSLVPSLEKSRIEEDLRVIKEDILNNTLPPYEAAVDHFTRDKFISREVKEFDKTFGRHAKLNVAGYKNYLEAIQKSLLVAAETVQALDDDLDKYFSKDNASASTTYAKANILKLIAVIDFANRYSRRLLMWTYHNEQLASGVNLNDPFSKAENEYMIANRNNYFFALKVISTKTKDVVNLIKAIPNVIVVPEEVEVVKSTLGNKIDPLSVGILPEKINFIYGIRKVFAEWQVSRYKASVEEKRALEYRLLALKEAREDGVVDAKLEQEIEYSENRLRKLLHKIAKFEEELE